MSEETNKPARYQLPGQIEAIDLIIQMCESLGIPAWAYMAGNVLKYLTRLGRKDGVDPITDLKKARWYIDEAIRLQGGESWNPEPRPMARGVMGDET